MSSVTVPAQPSGRSAVLDFLTRRGPAGLVLWTIVISGAFRLLFAVLVGYGIGEGYYLAGARRLALSYFDQPPLSIWLAWATIQIDGVGSVIINRLPYLFIFAGTTWLIYRLGARLFGAWAGAWSAVILNLSLVFTISVASWVQPDGPLFLFLVAAALPIVELAFGAPKRPLLLWALAGLFFGLAFLAKYHAALTLGGLLLFVLTTPGHRKWFFGWGPVVAGAVALVVVLPVLIWNWQNDWVSIAFQGERIEGHQLRFDWLARSIAGQATLIGLLIWPPLMVVGWKALRAGWGAPRSWFLICLAAIPILLFTAAALWAPLGWHFHWQAPGYVFLFPLLGKAIADRLERGDRLTRRWLAISAVLLVALLVGLAAHARTGWLRVFIVPFAKDLPYADTNPTGELLAWDGLRQALAAKGLLLRDRLFVVSPSWTEVGKVDTQLGDDLPVVVLSGDPRNIAFSQDPRRFAGWDAVIVTARRNNMARQYGAYFAAIDPPFTVDVMLAGDVALTLNVWLAHDYRQPYPLPYGPGASH